MQPLLKYLFLLILPLILHEVGYGQVQPLPWKDYTAPGQMNIGSGTTKATDSSAYLELGKGSGSNKGLLLPRGNKIEVAVTKEGLVFYDLVSHRPVYHDGTAWRFFDGGDTSLVFTPPLVKSGVNISIPAANGTTNGYLTAAKYLEFSAKQDALAFGTTAQYIRGNHTLATFPTALSSFTNDSNYLTAYTAAALFAGYDSLGNYTRLQRFNDSLAALNTRIAALQSYTPADSLHYINGLYKVGNQVMAYYWQPMWNASMIQGKFVEAVQPRNFTFLGYDSLYNVYRNYRIDSIVAAITEADPVFNASAAAGISSGDIANWNTAYSWGDHAGAGYLTNITGLISPGTNITFTGTGTTADPYVINGSAGGGGIDDVLAFGQLLTADRTINTNTSKLTITGAPSTAYANTLNVYNTNATGNAVYAESNGINASVSARNTKTDINGGWSYYGFSVGSNPTMLLRRDSSSTNKSINIATLQARTTGTPASGIGAALAFEVETDILDATISNRIASKFTDVVHTSRTSQLDIFGMDNAVEKIFMNVQTGGIVRVNNNADTLATRAYARSFGGGGGGGSVTSVGITNGFGMSASLTNPTTTPNITLTLDSATLFSYSVRDIYNRNDSLFKYKNGSEIFVGLFGGGGSSITNYDSTFKVSGDTLKFRDYVNVKSYGAVGDGVTDDLTAFQNALADGRPVFVPDGTYYLDGPGDGSVLLTMPDSSKLFGNGEIKWKAGDKAIALGYGSVISGLRLTGSGKTAGQAFESGITVFGKTNWRIENVIIEQVSGNPTANGGGAIYINSLFSATNFKDGGSVINCILTNNGTGLNIDERGEYVTFQNVRSTYSTTGIALRAGNNTFTNCHIDDNATGLKMTAGTNSGHGTFSACTFNHNSTKGFDITDESIGMIFQGCHFYSDASSITNSTNIHFNDCFFGGDVGTNTVTLTTSTNIQRIGGMFDAVTSVVSGEDMKLITMPTGGTTGQALVKSSNNDYDAEWGTVSGGGSSVTDSIQVVANDTLMTGNFAFNSTLRRLTFKADSFYIHIAITDSVRHTSPASGYETEADTYFAAVATAGGTLTTADKDAYNAWVVAEKSASRYTKYTAIYPMMGGTAAAHAINAKNPGTYNITWNGTLTHSSLGVDPGGTSSDYGNTGIVFNVLAQNSNHISIYINEDNNSNGYDMGAVSTTAESSIAIVSRWSDDTYYAYGTSNTLQTVANTNAIGHYIVSRTASTEFRMSKGTVTTKTETSALPSSIRPILLGKGEGVAASTKRFCFATVGSGLTSTEMQGLASNTLTLQTALSRN